jgi:hypothetical protein
LNYIMSKSYENDQIDSLINEFLDKLWNWEYDSYDKEPK